MQYDTSTSTPACFSDDSEYTACHILYVHVTLYCTDIKKGCIVNHNICFVLQNFTQWLCNSIIHHQVQDSLSWRNGTLQLDAHCTQQCALCEGRLQLRFRTHPTFNSSNIHGLSREISSKGKGNNAYFVAHTVGRGDSVVSTLAPGEQPMGLHMVQDWEWSCKIPSYWIWYFKKVNCWSFLFFFLNTRPASIRLSWPQFFTVVSLKIKISVRSTIHFLMWCKV